MKLLRKFMAIFDRVVALGSGVAAIILLILVAIISLSVVTRYCFNYSFLWLQDVTEGSLLLVCFLLATWVLKREGHVRMDIVIDRFNPRAQDIINGITSIVMAVIWVTIIWYSTINSLTHFRMGLYKEEIIRTPYGLLYAIFAIGTFLLFVQSIRRANGYIRKWRVSSEMNKSSK